MLDMSSVGLGNCISCSCNFRVLDTWNVSYLDIWFVLCIFLWDYKGKLVLLTAAEALLECLFLGL